MHDLPHPQELNNCLPGLFLERTNSYKYFWFLALLDCAGHTEEFTVPMRDVARRMICIAWYPVNYFKLSFGVIDQLNKHIQSIREITGLAEDVSLDELTARMENPRAHEKKTLNNILNNICRYVPYRLLRPWFQEELHEVADTFVNGLIEKFAESYRNQPERAAPYSFEMDAGIKMIRFSEYWVWYLRDNYRVLREYTLWQLTEFLQRRNPNVADIASKLVKEPGNRNHVLATKLWRAYLIEHPEMKCIYSQSRLKSFSIDHFLPWSFVAHDQIWNTIPTTQSINSQKGNQIPEMDHYLDGFILRQFEFFHFQVRSSIPRKNLEDYSAIFREELSSIRQFSFEKFSSAMAGLIKPQSQFARNQGFKANWSWKA